MTGVLDPTAAARRRIAAVPGGIRVPGARRIPSLSRLPAKGEVLQPDGGAAVLRRVRAWMVVPAVDFALMMLPMAWRPPQWHATLALAVLGTVLLSGGSRYVAQLHLSVLDELPCIITRLFAAVAVIAAMILYLYEKSQVQVFLETACQAVALVLAGRVVTTRLIAMGRRSGIAKRRTVLIGGGPLAAELARIVAEHRQYGVQLDGFVDDGDDVPAQEYVPRLGRLTDLDAIVSATGVDTLLVADGCFEERMLIDAVRTAACRHTELLVVPRLHYFHTLTGTADHIGSIPIMRIGNPNLHGPARLVKRLFDITVSVVALVLLSPCCSAQRWRSDWNAVRASSFGRCAWAATEGRSNC